MYRLTVNEVWIGNWIEHLQIITTSGCTSVANSHNLQFTTACTKYLQSALSSSVNVPLLQASCLPRLAAISHQTPTHPTAV
jgi:hypothetical protein